jgi:hypothetical protein
MIPTYDYYCAQCDTPFCERVLIMNLAMDKQEDELCLNCLAAEQAMEPQAFMTFVSEYVHSRDCFLTPWTNWDAQQCPGLLPGAEAPCHRCQ